MSIPFTSAELELCENPAYRVRPGRRIVSSASQRVDFLANRYTRGLLDAIAEAPYLTRLNLIIPPHWLRDTEYRPSERLLRTVEKTASGPEGYFRAYLNAPDVWEDMAVLLQQKPKLEITVIRLYWCATHVPVLMKYEVAHERLARKL